MESLPIHIFYIIGNYINCVDNPPGSCPSFRTVSDVVRDHYSISLSCKLLKTYLAPNVNSSKPIHSNNTKLSVEDMYKISAYLGPQYKIHKYFKYSRKQFFKILNKIANGRDLIHERELYLKSRNNETTIILRQEFPYDIDKKYYSSINRIKCEKNKIICVLCGDTQCTSFEVCSGYWEQTCADCAEECIFDNGIINICDECFYNLADPISWYVARYIQFSNMKPFTFQYILNNPIPKLKCCSIEFNCGCIFGIYRAGFSYINSKILQH